MLLFCNLPPKFEDQASSQGMSQYGSSSQWSEAHKLVNLAYVKSIQECLNMIKVYMFQTINKRLNT